MTVRVDLTSNASSTVARVAFHGYLTEAICEIETIYNEKLVKFRNSDSILQANSILMRIFI